MKKMRSNKFFICALLLGACAAPAGGQVTFDESGLSDALPYPEWTTPTPACYDLTTETHYDIKMGSCDCDCSNGVSHTSHATRYSTRGNGVAIFYPPFAEMTISFTKNRDDWSAWGKCPTRTATENWHSSAIITNFDGDVDDFGGLNHLRYSSYLFDEAGSSRSGTTSSCPFGAQSGWWHNDLLCAAAKLVRFNRMPIIASDLERSDHVKTNVVKQVYYCDADKDDRSLKTWVGSGDVRTYCFAPRGSGYLAHGAFSTDDRNMEGAHNAVEGFYSAYDKAWGSTDGSSSSYKFKVSDWLSLAADAGSVTVRENDASSIPNRENVKKLNSGVEVYIVVLAGEEVEYAKLQNSHAGGKVKFYGKPRLLRTHVYPVKPKWKRAMFGNNFCINDAPVDLAACVDMGTQPFSGKFAVVEGSADILDGSTLDVSKVAVNGNLAGRQPIRIRCYPYWTCARNSVPGKNRQQLQQLHHRKHHRAEPKS